MLRMYLNSLLAECSVVLLSVESGDSMNESLSNLDFEVMWRERVVGRIVIENDVLVLNENYVDNLYENQFRFVKDAITVREMLKGRVVCPSRFYAGLQKAFGFEEWDLLKMLKDTHGVDVNDYQWIRFEGEEIEWNEVKVRD
jgi:hypothetical protein